MPTLIVAFIGAAAEVAVTIVGVASTVSGARDANVASTSVGGRNTDNAVTEDNNGKKLSHSLVLIMAPYRAARICYGEMIRIVT